MDFGLRNDIMLAIDQKMAVLLVMLDLSSAFDTIDHDILIARLSKSFGLRGLALQWFSSYLTGRQSRVGVGNVFSDDQSVNFGVPQGSVIGPFLFNLYTKPVAHIIDNHHLHYHIYADDTQIYTYFKPSIPGDSDRALHKLSTCIKEIRHWMVLNKLKLNEDKTEFFIAASPRLINSLTSLTLQIGEATIHPSSTVKNLGVIFDSSMSMSHHITSICKSLNFHLRNLNRIRKYIDQPTCHHASSVSHHLPP